MRTFPALGSRLTTMFESKWQKYHPLSNGKVVGAEPEEVAVMNSLTTNLHLMMIPFYRPTAQRHKLMVEAGCFPSDQYAVESQVALHGFDPKKSLIELRPRPGEHCLRTEDILAAIEREGNETALIMLSGVQYYTGQAFNIQAITAAGHAKGCRVGWDLAHAAGNLRLSLHDWNVDFAAWCTYKYLNSGPGNIGGCFVHRNNFDIEPRLKGWWGHTLTTRFNMRQPFDAEVGAYGFRLSNPPVLCVASLLASLELFEEVGMDRLVAKQQLLTMYAEILFRDLPVEIITPKDPAERGCQLSLLFKPEELEPVSEGLAANGFICDKRYAPPHCREPNCMRVAPAPLYNSFEDVHKLYLALKGILEGLKSKL